MPPLAGGAFYLAQNWVGNCPTPVMPLKYRRFFCCLLFLALLCWYVLTQYLFWLYSNFLSILNVLSTLKFEKKNNCQGCYRDVYLCLIFEMSIWEFITKIGVHCKNQFRNQMDFLIFSTWYFEIEKKSSDTRYFKNQVEIDRGQMRKYLALKSNTFANLNRNKFSLLTRSYVFKCTRNTCNFKWPFLQQCQMLPFCLSVLHCF